MDRGGELPEVDVGLAHEVGELDAARHDRLQEHARARQLATELDEHELDVAAEMLDRQPGSKVVRSNEE